MIREPVVRALADTGAEPESPLRDYINALRRRWWVVAIVFLAVVTMAMWRTSLQPRLYKATSTVRIEEAPVRLTGIQSPVTRVDYRIDPMQSEQRVIQSQEIGERVADSLGLRLAIIEPGRLARNAIVGRERVRVRYDPESYADVQLRFGDTQYVVVENGRETGSARYGEPVVTAGLSLTVPRRPASDLREAVLHVVPLAAAGSRVRGATTTRPIPQTNVMEISFQSTDPLLAQQAANQIALVYQDFSREDRREQAAAYSAWISQNLGVQAERLRGAQDALGTFKQHEQIANVQAAQTALTQSIARLESERDEALIEQGIYRTLLGALSAADTATAELRKLAATNAVQSNAHLKTLYDRWFEVSKDRETFMGQKGRGPTDMEVAVFDRLIASTKEEIRDGSANYLAGLASRLSSLNSRIGELRRDLARYTPLEQQELRLLTDLAIVQTLYEQLQSEYQRARIAENDESGYVAVIDRAQQPTAPISPLRKRIFITAVVLGLMLGVGAALLLENLDDSVRSPDDLRVAMGLPVLGTIPRIREAMGSRRSAGAPTSRLVTHLDPRSPVAEAYRSLRTNLAFANPGGALRTIVFTSPGPADGKSTTAANLAITLAQQGQRTLIIDADLRRAVLDKIFGSDRSPGLTDLLVGRASLEEVVRPTAIENLYVLPSGAFPPNPSELLGSASMRAMLERAGEHYDTVLLDSPPLLAVTDAAVLSTVADATVLVVRRRATSRAAVRRALGQLSAVQGRLVGAVLNDVDVRDSGYGAGYGYYYYYYGSTESNGQQAGVGHRLMRWARGDARKG